MLGPRLVSCELMFQHPKKKIILGMLFALVLKSTSFMGNKVYVPSNLIS